MHSPAVWRIPSASFPIRTPNGFASTVNGSMNIERTDFRRFAWKSAFGQMRDVCSMRSLMRNILKPGFVFLGTGRSA